jgi:hypothetical protein
MDRFKNIKQLRVEKTYKFRPSTQGKGGSQIQFKVYVFDKSRNLIDTVESIYLAMEKYDITRTSIDRAIKKEILYNDTWYFSKTNFLCS